MKKFLFLALTLFQISSLPVFSDNHFSEEEEEVIPEQEIIFDND